MIIVLLYRVRSRAISAFTKAIKEERQHESGRDRLLLRFSVRMEMDSVS